jgi:hypothetical protein
MCLAAMQRHEGHPHNPADGSLGVNRSCGTLRFELVLVPVRHIHDRLSIMAACCFRVAALASFKRLCRFHFDNFILSRIRIFRYRFIGLDSDHC